VITSKDGVGAYAMAAFPIRWHPIICRRRVNQNPLSGVVDTIAACRAARRRVAPTRFTPAVFQEVLASMRAVIDDATPRTRPKPLTPGPPFRAGRAGVGQPLRTTLVPLVAAISATVARGPSADDPAGAVAWYCMEQGAGTDRFCG